VLTLLLYIHENETWCKFLRSKTPKWSPPIYVKLTTQVRSSRGSKSCKVVFSINLSHAFVAVTYPVVTPRLDFFFKIFFSLFLSLPSIVKRRFELMRFPYSGVILSAPPRCNVVWLKYIKASIKWAHLVFRQQAKHTYKYR